MFNWIPQFEDLLISFEIHTFANKTIKICQQVLHFCTMLNPRLLTPIILWPTRKTWLDPTCCMFRTYKTQIMARKWNKNAKKCFKKRQKKGNKLVLQITKMANTPKSNNVLYARNGSERKVNVHCSYGIAYLFLFKDKTWSKARGKKRAGKLAKANKVVIYKMREREREAKIWLDYKLK